MDYDETKAIKYIRTKLSPESNSEYDDDEILNVIDMIWDYYEDNGFCSMDFENGPDELDTEDLLKYVKKIIAKDSMSPLKFDDVDIIVNAELEFEDMLDAQS